MNETMPNPDDETAALLWIPTFLRVGHPDRDEAIRRGAEALAKMPPAERRKPTPPDPRTQKPTAAQERALEKLGWQWHHILKINREEAALYVEKQWGPEVRFVSKTRWDKPKEGE